MQNGNRERFINFMIIASMTIILGSGIVIIFWLRSGADPFEPVLAYFGIISGLIGIMIGIWQKQQDKEERLNEIKGLKDHTTSEHNKTRDLQSQSTRDEIIAESDLRILRELWKYITSTIINHIVDYTGTTQLEGDYVSFTIHRYQDIRSDRPELHFIADELEDAFLKFDNILNDFVRILATEATVELYMGKWVYLSGYHEVTKKDRILLVIHDINEERLQQLLDRHHRIDSYALKLRKAHTELVKAIQQLVPQFDFPDDKSALEKMQVYQNRTGR